MGKRYNRNNRFNHNQSYIKAPYNFVPLNKEIVTPHWSNYVSHDIPFNDSTSGEIEIIIEAKSPIFVRDGGSSKTKEEELENKTLLFSQFNNNYFIPGSTIKGMLRNVMEIMSFGRMTANDHRYAVRDLNNPDKSFYKNHFKPDKTRCGFLEKKENGEYVITDHGIPGRISHEDLDTGLNSDFSAFFGKKGDFEQNNENHKSANFKYNRFSDLSISRDSFFDEGHEDKGGRKIHSIGTIKKGTIIFTGQPSRREQKPDKKNGGMKWVGKHLEFIFFDQVNPNIFLVSKEIIKDFKFAYFDHDENQQSDDWKMWKIKLNKGEKIPVFFMPEKDNENQIKHLGLSYLYKLPYKNSVQEAIKKFQTKTTEPDLASTIFGFVNGTEDNELNFLKGRIHIGHAFAKKDSIKIGKEKTEVLASPKASYYPNYIRQKIKNVKITGKYSTFKNEKVEIAGWKRYPIRHEGTAENPPPRNSDGSYNDKVATKFIPLLSGAIFTTKIRYHNLRKVELGALLSALTFHNTQNTFHSIGMAKPLGYGKISVSIANFKNTVDYLEEYEAFMNASLNNKEPQWHNSPQITELLTMASEQDNSDSMPSSRLAYMKLGIGNGGENHFIEAKNKEQALDKYSKLSNVKSKTAISLISQSDIKDKTEWIEYEKTALLSSRTPEELKKEHLRRTEILIERKLIEKKAFLLEQIKNRIEACKIKEIEQSKIKEREKLDDRNENRELLAKKEGLNLDSIDPSKRDAFKDLEKVARIFCGNLLGRPETRKLEKNPPEEGILPNAYKEQFIAKVREIRPFYTSIKNWDKNKRIATKWIGKKITDELWDELQNS